ncbi:hypothetical protein AVDCRST_MAG84-3756 [uncultured Microcoleus sp.]|uniref:Uncharacterized protein n=1 Tax=uncultured Microcoleus sp. TaxID=259945 RepID=A0A6J4MP17_9CYAN|nr:hypothetical protein AVDCRST_MAG84-3756 [uncultured Microcoleus sp.]
MTIYTKSAFRNLKSQKKLPSLAVELIKIRFLARFPKQVRSLQTDIYLPKGERGCDREDKF